jgi:hypothetical protein
VTIGGGFEVQPATLITFWRVDNGEGTIPLGSDVGGANINIAWDNPTGASKCRFLTFTINTDIFRKPGQN